MNVVIIGGGVSGLAAAALLAKDGWHVTVLEKNKTLGGRARVFKQRGFTFDMGPSWYLMPEVFEQFFAQFGKKTSDYYQLVRLNPRYQVRFSDGTHAVLTDDRAQNIALFESLEKGAGRKLQQFLKKMEQVYAAATERLMYESVWDVRMWTKTRNIQDLWQLLTTQRFWQSWDTEVAQYFKSEKLRQILEFPAVFLGGTPFNTPALYAILTWADFGKGVWYPKGGMAKVVEALVELAKEAGAEIKTSTEAVAIQVQEGKVTGVKTADGEYPADVVIGATDLPHLETKLLPPESRTWSQQYWEKRTYGISALLLYLGVNKKIPNLTHHTIQFSADWRQNFREIFETQTLPRDPSLYISVRSATDRKIVPKNSEEIVVLVPLGSGTYDQAALKKYSELIIEKLEHVLDVPLRKHLVVKKMFTPNDFQNDYNAYQGTALGLAHTLGQSLWLRPGNKSRTVKGLYYAGQYTNPGVGVPMALISAQIVARLVGQATNDADQNDQIFKNGSTTFYYSSLFFPGQVKKDIFTLYAYVRIVDDFVDRSIPLVTEIEHVWRETKMAWQGLPVSHTIIKNFVELAKRKHFEWEWVEAFWKAMRSDLQKKNYASFAELEPYIYGSAEVIGYMMARILHLPKVAMQTAALQGKAMQFVNFIRDVKEDDQLGRNYLGYTALQRKDKKAWAAFIRTQLQRYRQLQKAAEVGYQYLPKKYLVPIKTAAEMYSWTADQIEKNPEIVWERKVKPSKLRILWHVLKNSMRLS